VRFALGGVRTGFYGFHTIIDLAATMRSARSVECQVDMSAAEWLDANMCAPLGAVLYDARHEGSKISLSNMAAPVREVLQKNGFLSQFGLPLTRDQYETTIEYRRFERTGLESKEFQEYVNLYFRRGSRGLPDMTQALLKRFREKLFEIFENALEHSYTKHGVFACGQYYPKDERLDFTVVDLGIGFHGNIKKNLGHCLQPIEAIQWALSGKTTRRGRPGGLGLKLLQEFIRLNRGRLIIVSHTGYWELSRGQVSTNSFPKPFPGTALTVEINTADKNAYCLSAEIGPSDIF
jgi:hypothetical protein